jgi:hypothetical protein
VDKKHVALIWVAIIGVIAFFAFPPARWGLFSMRVNEITQKLPEEPTAEQVKTLRADLQQAARQYKLDPAKLQFGLTLEEHDMMGAAVFWYVTATVSDGAGKTTKSERKLKTVTIDDAFEQTMTDAGIPVTRVKRTQLGPVSMPASPAQGGQ